MQFWTPFLNSILNVIIGFVDILFEIFKIIFDVYYFFSSFMKLLNISVLKNIQDL